jgi:hypothetical protein
MKQLAALLCLQVLTAACGATAPTMPTTTSAPALSSNGFPLHFVGEQVVTALEHNDQDLWEFTARSDGKLAVRVNWTAAGTVALSLDDVLSSQSNKAPIVGRMQVTVGQRIRVKIAQPAAWPDGEGWYLPITVSTVME